MLQKLDPKMTEGLILDGPDVKGDRIADLKWATDVVNNQGRRSD